MVDIAPLFRECIALMSLDELKETEKILRTCDYPAAKKAVTEIQTEKIKRTKNA